MKFVIDQQLPPARADWLRARGHDAEHVFLLGMSEWDDGLIWDWAIANGAIIVTKDSDFANRRRASAAGPVLLWLRVGNTTTPALLHRLDEQWADIEASLLAERMIVEVR